MKTNIEPRRGTHPSPDPSLPKSTTDKTGTAKANPPASLLVAFVALVALLGLASTAAGADPAASPGPDARADADAQAATDDGPGVEELLALHVQALGGKSALEGVKSVSRNGTLSLDAQFGAPIEGLLELRILPRRKVFVDSQLGSFSTTSAWDGTTAWEKGPQGLRLLEGAELQRLARQSDLFFSTGLWRDQSWTIERLSDAALDGELHHRLRVVEADPSGEGSAGEAPTVYLHSKTHLLSQMLYPMEIPGLGQVVAVLEFWNYEDHGGVMLANSVSTLIEGLFSTEAHFTETTVNGDIDDAVFDLPK